MTSWTGAGVTDPGFSGSYTYDDTNRTRTVTVDYGSFTKSHTYRYDAMGRKTSFTGPDSVEIASADGKLAGINIPSEGTIGYSYNANGSLYSQTIPGGSTRYFGYDAMREGEGGSPRIAKK